MSCIYVSGYGSGAGKSSVCLAILTYLHQRRRDVTPLAYVKPVTQCEAVTEVAEYCSENGIDCVAIGAVVFRPGFTNEVIADVTFLSRRRQLLDACKEQLTNLIDSHSITVIDGVGYPSVGSCCGVGCGDVAASVHAPVVLVAPNGLGDALDTMELMISYFHSRSCRVVGVVFNKVKDTARHKLDVTEPLIRKYMAELHPGVAVLGFVADRATTEEMSGAIDMQSMLEAIGVVNAA